MLSALRKSNIGKTGYKYSVVYLPKVKKKQSEPSQDRGILYRRLSETTVNRSRRRNHRRIPAHPHEAEQEDQPPPANVQVSPSRRLTNRKDQTGYSKPQPTPIQQSSDFLQVGVRESYPNSQGKNLKNFAWSRHLRYTAAVASGYFCIGCYLIS